MVDPGSVLALVLAGHLVGDFVIQTDWQAANKVWPQPPSPVTTEPGTSQRLESWRAMFWHVGTYGLVMTNLVGLVQPWGWRLVVFGWVNNGTHAFIDRRWPVRWLMRHTGSAAFAETSWGVLAVDQALHLSILALLVAALFGG